MGFQGKISIHPETMPSFVTLVKCVCPTSEWTFHLWYEYLSNMIKNQLATLYTGGGCFWCIEAVYKRIPGVIQTIPGYGGGTMDNPTYESVCSGRTGHVELVELHYDPAIINLHHILAIFFNVHDPTSLDRQGADSGSQYRSAIFTTSNEDLIECQAFIRTTQNEFRDTIVTKTGILDRFFPAEDYHHAYYEKNHQASYCRLVIAPKLVKAGLDHSPLVVSVAGSKGSKR